MNKILVMPDWQQIETAPKDGTEINLSCISVDFRTGTLYNFVARSKWGDLGEYDGGFQWCTVEDDDAFYCDIDFTEQKDNNYSLWRGCKITHWSPVWEVEVIHPPIPSVTFSNYKL